MNLRLCNIDNSQFYRGNELPSAGMEAPRSKGEGGMSTQSYSAINSKQPQVEGLSKEREEELNAFMDSIMAFIRKIDINNL